MKEIRAIRFHTGSREELLPDFAPDFPYICTRAEIDRYAGGFVPWHWHRAVELFYIQRGTLEYFTPHTRLTFPAGTGGFVNSNVLHMTRAQPGGGPVTQLLHIFDPALIAGEPGGRIERSFVLPVLTGAPELLALDPHEPSQAASLTQLRAAFALSPQEPGYELRLRAALSELWAALFAAMPLTGSRHGGMDDKIKQMMAYLYEHYAEKVTVSELAASAYLSERECYRIFREQLHTTPAEYLCQYRVQAACRMLLRTDATVSAVGYACGLGSGSYFGKVFREVTGYTPSAYREAQQAPTGGGPQK